MNKDYIIYNLKEAKAELESILEEIDEDTEYDEGVFLIAMKHLYHHVNTAWNSRDSTEKESTECSQKNFDKWRQFPNDIYME
jgi:hypothetical protein